VLWGVLPGAAFVEIMLFWGGFMANGAGGVGVGVHVLCYSLCA